MLSFHLVKEEFEEFAFNYDVANCKNQHGVILSSFKTIYNVSVNIINANFSRREETLVKRSLHVQTEMHRKHSHFHLDISLNGR